MQLSTLVLPAPFGPIRASSSPGRVSKEMPSSTFSPPKESDTPASLSSAIPAAAAAVLLDLAVAAALVTAAEVELTHVLVRPQPFGRAVEDDAAVFHHVAVVGDVERHLRVLLDQQQRGAEPVANGAQRPAQLGDHQRGETERQLVDEQEFRRAHQRRADSEHLPLAAGEITRFPAA